MNGVPLRVHVAPVDAALATGAELALPEVAARHVQVRRLQPGDALRLFDGRGSDWPAEVLAMGRREVRVRVAAPQPVARELPVAVTLACGMPANERMDALVEKATELGAAAIQPLLCERAVLRLEGERAERRRAHWEAVAVAACEQCGRARLPGVYPVAAFATWLAALPPDGALRIVLSTDAQATPLARLVPIDPPRAERAACDRGERGEAGAGLGQGADGPRQGIVVLSGPEDQAAATQTIGELPVITASGLIVPASSLADIVMTAEGLLCRQYLGWPRNDERLVAGADYLLRNRLNYHDRDVYYWYYATQVLHHMEGTHWDEWNKVMRQEIPSRQVKSGREAGSWDPGGENPDRWGNPQRGEGGRLYVTCLSTYMLEVYYRHLPIYRSRDFLKADAAVN